MSKEPYYSSKSVSEHSDIVVYSNFICAECGYSPIRFKSLKCEQSNCNCNFDRSRKIGIDVLESLQNNTKKEKIIKKIKDTYQDKITFHKYSNFTISTEKLNKIYDFYLNQYLNNKRRAINYIYVKKLFGYHSYKISFDSNNKISIIYGPNGFGKTTIFKLMNAFVVRGNDLKKQLEYIFSVPFNTFRLGFENDKYIEIKKIGSKMHFNYRMFDGFSILDSTKLTFIDPRKDSNTIYDYQLKNVKLFIKHFDNIDLILPRINEKSRFLFVKTNRSSIFDQQNTIITLKKNFDKLYNKKHSFVFQNLDRNIDLNMFDNHLNAEYEYIQSSLEDSYYFLNLKKLKPSINKKEFNKIKNSELFNTFLNEKGINPIYQSKTNGSHFMNEEDAGILKSWYDIVHYAYDFVNKIEKLNMYFYSLYNIKDPSRKSLCFYNDEFKLKNVNGKKIDPKLLSSGELNMLTILYSLIFETEDGSFILIDEPEISIHISWQERIVDVILELCADLNCQVIIASHSPFVGGRHIEFASKIELLKDIAND